MARFRQLLVWMAVGSGAWPGMAAAQQVVGSVVDSESLAPVASALVRAVDLNVDREVAMVLSDPQGGFRIGLPQEGGIFRITLETLFHQVQTVDSLRVQPGETVVLPEVVLMRAPIELDEVRVEGERSGLTRGSEWVRQHQLLGEGTFLAGAVVAVSPWTSLGALVADETGLWGNYDARGRPRLSNPRGGLSRCVDVLVNRWPIDRTGFESVDDIPREQIAAIEIYNGYFDRPPGYSFDGDASPSCGLVNVWLWNAW